MSHSEETPANENGVNSTTSDSLNSDTTEPTSTGQPQYQTVRQKLDIYTERLEIHMKDKGLPHPLPRGIDQYLSMDRSELNLLSADQIGEIAFEISCYAYYLQDQQNQYIAKAEKCKYEIDKLIGHLLQNYTVYGSEEKRLAAIHDNEAAHSWRESEIKSRAVVARMAYLSSRLESISKALLDLANSKRRQHA